ncbi:hypothetical protein L6Q21_05230 [Sandaracinobacter sp. RS1-74]|uniref:hypothetical protein n=1 Tax=Sandaracinobacteroides sayramensis TaxID=2913411 RepID=UPI001EDB7AEC|nr:hypothetical protein [Sandaracinobacteroides sayramensis]MCG2840380.1 hypothetical protein [Sandaracinobacteroides sayramensis]
MRHFLALALLALASPAAAAGSFFEALKPLCGKAFAGAMESREAADADLAGQPLSMHVASCTDTEIRIPFLVGDNRSRTWFLTATPRGMQLKHRHRHEDGSLDAVTNYGGEHVGPAIAGPDGTLTLRFPADAESKAMFQKEGLPQSVTNVWEMAILPGSRFTYRLTRPNRDFRVGFDLSKEVPVPAEPWGGL